jgi:hypothetical protein
MMQRQQIYHINDGACTNCFLGKKEQHINNQEVLYNDWKYLKPGGSKFGHKFG